MTIQEAFGKFAESAKAAAIQGHSFGPVYVSREGGEVLVFLENKTGDIISTASFEDDGQMSLEDVRLVFKMIGKLVS